MFTFLQCIVETTNSFWREFCQFVKCLHLSYNVQKPETLSFWRDFSVWTNSWNFVFILKISLWREKFVKICLHWSFTIQMSFILTDFFFKSWKYSWNLVYIEASQYELLSVWRNFFQIMKIFVKLCFHWSIIIRTSFILTIFFPNLENIRETLFT